MSLSLVSLKALQTPLVLTYSAPGVNNGPYIIEQQRLHTPGTIEANIWPVGTDRQLVFTPGSFQINIVRP